MNTEKTDRSGLIDLMALTETPSFGFGETLVRVNHVDQGVRTGLAVEVPQSPSRKLNCKELGDDSDVNDYPLGSALTKLDEATMETSRSIAGTIARLIRGVKARSHKGTKLTEINVRRLELITMNEFKENVYMIATPKMKSFQSGDSLAHALIAKPLPKLMVSTLSRTTEWVENVAEDLQSDDVDAESGDGNDILSN